MYTNTIFYKKTPLYRLHHITISVSTFALIYKTEILDFYFIAQKN